MVYHTGFCCFFHSANVPLNSYSDSVPVISFSLIYVLSSQLSGTLSQPHWLLHHWQRVLSPPSKWDLLISLWKMKKDILTFIPAQLWESCPYEGISHLVSTCLLSNRNKKDFGVKLVLWWVALSVQCQWLIQLTGTVEAAISLLKKGGWSTHIWRRVDSSRPPVPIPTLSGCAWEPDTSIS